MRFTCKSEESDTVDYMGCGEKVFDQIMPVKNFKLNRKIEFVVDLSPALEDTKLGIGQVGVIIVPTVAAHYPNYWYSRPIIRTWIQCTKLGLDLFQGPDVTEYLTCLTPPDFVRLGNRLNQRTAKERC